MGVDGVHYMIENAKEAKLKFHFGAPSCVPATGFETSGAELTPADVKTLLESDDIFYDSGTCATTSFSQNHLTLQEKASTKQTNKGKQLIKCLMLS